MTPTNETTVQISIPSSAPAELLQRVRSLARDLAAIADISVELAEIRSCQKCGCTDEKGCMFGCSWASETEDLCTSCAPAPSVSLLIRQLVGYSRLADEVITAANREEDFHLNLQECIENRSGFYIPADELKSVLDALTQLEPGSSDKDAVVLLQEQLERTVSFYIPVDELEAAICDLQARGWSVIISAASE